MINNSEHKTPVGKNEQFKERMDRLRASLALQERMPRCIKGDELKRWIKIYHLHPHNITTQKIADGLGISVSTIFRWYVSNVPLAMSMAIIELARNKKWPRLPDENPRPEDEWEQACELLIKKEIYNI